MKFDNIFKILKKRYKDYTERDINIVKY